MLDAWGKPDAVEGSGLTYLTYRLDDGNYVLFLFGLQSPQPLRKAIWKNAMTGEGKILFDETNESNKGK